MSDKLQVSPVHLAELIEDELAERGWSLDELATRMQPDATREQWGINRLALDLFLAVRCPKVILGVMAEQFGTAFDIDPQLFQNFHERWRSKAGPCHEACCVPMLKGVH